MPNKILVGSQLYGWGQYYARDKKAMNNDDVFAALRDAGYDFAEGSWTSAGRRTTRPSRTSSRPKACGR